MVAFISIVFAITMLLVTVYGLHKYQNFETGLNAERSIPLPPLDESEIQHNSIYNPGEIEIEAATDDEKAQVSGWMEEVATLKAAGNFADAMAVCQQEFPLWSAYNQAAIILRANLKFLSPEDPETDTILRELYRIAAIAETLHEKSASSRHLSLSQLKRLALDEIDGLVMDYKLLGYANLRLIRKSDIKLMVSLWGRPSQHSHPRTLHEAWWNSFTSHV